MPRRQEEAPASSTPSLPTSPEVVFPEPVDMAAAESTTQTGEEAQQDTTTCDNCNQPAKWETTSGKASTVRFCADHKPANFSEIGVKRLDGGDDEG